MADDGRTIALVPARLDSTRLPSKQLRRINGRPLIWYLTERMETVPVVDEVVVATTDRDVDTPLVEWAREEGVCVYKGAHEDVLGRFESAAQEFRADYVVRANGDNPLLSPEMTKTGIVALKKDDLEFITGKYKYTSVPVGLGPELLRIEALSKLASKTSDPSHREHVTTYIFDNPEVFRWGPIPVPKNWKAPELSLTVDTHIDFEYVSKVIRALPDRPPGDWNVEEIIAACRKIEAYDND